MLERIRLKKVLPYVQGRLLDLGCGFNNLTRLYGSGVGVDVYPWSGVDVLVEDTALLPFSARSFDTVTLLASLNHIPNRSSVLHEVKRVLADDGKLILTMISPLTGILAHILFQKDERMRGGLRDGEKLGMTNHEVISLLQEAGFIDKIIVPFEFYLNKVYVSVKAS